MFRKIYDKTMALAAHRHALRSLAVVSFLESSVFFVPPHLMMVPMVLATPERAWRIALVTTLASVAGGLLGYAIGFYFFDLIGTHVIAAYGVEDKFARFAEGYNEWGAWIVALFGATPFPYKVITIASGVTALNLLTFTLASLASRGLIFFLIAALLKYFGPPMQAFIEKRLGLIMTAAFLAVIGGFVALKFL